ncbi:MAG: carbohydrate binding family 9 domain-containing protein, partial [Phaeodactylibacter sp.]|nr:carbohydrate binding family 9 domain-containing protein [Phaeodactylibacter sp.]
VTPSLRRDFRAGGNDNISLIFDTFNDKTNAFLFGINPYGVRREALISGGGSTLEGFQTSWDNKWDGEAMIYEGYWTAELAIPFKTLRFKEGGTSWRFNSYRFDTQANEQTLWVPIPRNQWIFNLAYMGDMHFDAPLQKPGTNISLIPYVAGSVVQDFENGLPEPALAGAIGADAKIGISAGLNLDITVNPDFSQVEVDRQVTNLSRFELFFPERRQFFLENADLFNSFGFSDQNPFFSRRIGITEDTLTEENIPNAILFGARLSGKLNENLRVGLLNMQTAKDLSNDLPGFNYTVAAVQQKVFARSNIGAILVNKQQFSGDSSSLYDPYNRLAGLDYVLASEDNTWTGKLFYHHAFTAAETQTFRGQHGANLQYNSRNFRADWTHQYIGRGFDAQVGFVPRTDLFRIRPELTLLLYPQGQTLNRVNLILSYMQIWAEQLGTTDQGLKLRAEFEFLNTSRINSNLEYSYIKLLDELNPTGLDEELERLPIHSDYSTWLFQLSYRSDIRKNFSLELKPEFGQFYNGRRYGLSGNIQYRFQPYGAISLDYNFNRIQLPAPFLSPDLLLLGPRLDLTFTRKLFLTAFVQFNNQIDNVNINARLQWRFKPVSDFFLVYTENYFANDFSSKNRAIVAKFTYWLNI